MKINYIYYRETDYQLYVQEKLFKILFSIIYSKIRNRKESSFPTGSFEIKIKNLE